jgi:hypothetical protein
MYRPPQYRSCKSLSSLFNQESAPKTAHDLAHRLLEHGWAESNTSPKVITRVFLKPKTAADEPSAVRISLIGDRGFYQYAKLCMRHPSPHFQKVYDHGFLENGAVHVTLSERLHPVPSIRAAKEPLKSELRAFWNLANHIFPYADKNGLHIKPRRENVISLHAENTDEAEIKARRNHLREVSPSLHDALSVLLQSQLWLSITDLHISDPYPDLMPSNIMIRKSGVRGKPPTIVLADPIPQDRQNTELYKPDAHYWALANVFGPPPIDILRTLSV